MRLSACRFSCVHVDVYLYHYDHGYDHVWAASAATGLSARKTTCRPQPIVVERDTQPMRLFMSGNESRDFRMSGVISMNANPLRDRSAPDIPSIPGDR